jgi:hypothetical protein
VMHSYVFADFQFTHPTFFVLFIYLFFRVCFVLACDLFFM